VEAEDGIRDWSVTGVQTCALPIYRVEEEPMRAARDEHDRMRVHVGDVGPHPEVGGVGLRSRGIGALAHDDRHRRLAELLALVARSEERRVGKGGRWRRGACPSDEK